MWQAFRRTRTEDRHWCASQHACKLQSTCDPPWSFASLPSSPGLCHMGGSLPNSYCASRVLHPTCRYEVIREGRPAHLYFDLEYPAPLNPQVEAKLGALLLMGWLAPSAFLTIACCVALNSAVPPACRLSLIAANTAALPALPQRDGDALVDCLLGHVAALLRSVPGCLQTCC